MVIEKPFGHDLASALALDRDLLRFLRPDQIYRIDHYLGKETVQNLLAFRFGNAIFEPLFNRQYVDHVQITVAETVGMEGRRGAFYDHAGALRDVVQNHMLQLLALVAMEPPATLKSRDISDAKLKVLRNLAPLRGADGGPQRGARPVRAGTIGRQAGARATARRKRWPDVDHRDLRRHARYGGELALGRRAVLAADRQVAAAARDRDRRAIQAAAAAASSAPWNATATSATCPKPSRA